MNENPLPSQPNSLCDQRQAGGTRQDPPPLFAHGNNKKCDTLRPSTATSQETTELNKKNNLQGLKLVSLSLFRPRPEMAADTAPPPATIHAARARAALGGTEVRRCVEGSRRLEHTAGRPLPCPRARSTRLGYGPLTTSEARFGGRLRTTSFIRATIAPRGRLPTFRRQICNAMQTKSTHIATRLAPTPTAPILQIIAAVALPSDGSGGNAGHSFTAPRAAWQHT